MEQSTQSYNDVNIANNINLEATNTTAFEVLFQTTSFSVLSRTSSTPQSLSHVNRTEPIIDHTAHN